jgi:hypothetical protein
MNFKNNISPYPHGRIRHPSLWRAIKHPLRVARLFRFSLLAEFHGVPH